MVPFGNWRKIWSARSNLSQLIFFSAFTIDYFIMHLHNASLDSIIILSFLIFSQGKISMVQKHPTRQFCKISGGMVSWKIVCVLTKFQESSTGKFDLSLWYFFLLENRMCSCGILRILSWKFWSVLIVHFSSPGKFIYFLIPFLVLLENLMCSNKRIMSSPGLFTIRCVLVTSKPPGKFNVF